MLIEGSFNLRHLMYSRYRVYINKGKKQVISVATNLIFIFKIPFRFFSRKNSTKKQLFYYNIYFRQSL